MSDRKITEAVQRLAGTQLADSVSLIPAQVLSVNIDTRTCDVTAVGGTAVTDIPGVQLMADVEDGLLIVPVIGSTVIVSYTKRNTPFVSMFSAVQSVILATMSGVQFEDGSFGGMVKVEELIVKLNNLENLVNDLVDKFNTHTHSGVTTGSGVSAIPVIPEPNTLTLSKREDIENELIKHGI
jgi:hypothetical protein